MNKKTQSNSLPRKKAPLIFYVISILIPLLFFVILEIGLRIGNYGMEYKVFTKLEGYNTAMLYVNPDLSYKYFSNLNSTVFRQGIGFLEEKPENGYRVFVLGGSSAQGFPYAQNASFPSHLQQRLDRLHPEKVIEVINLGASAINTYTLLDILPEVLKQSPDLILIYAGHNEYYGALGPGSSRSIHPTLTRLLLYLRDFRLVQLMENLLDFSPKKSKNENASLMQRMIGESVIELGSDTYEKGLVQFDQNYSAMLKMVKDAEVPLIIGTLSSNLGGHKPFNSDQKDENGLSSADHYKMGKELMVEDSVSAKAHFIAAKELDGLRFRAPEKINAMIREKAKEFEVPLVELDSVFSSNSSSNITGNNLMCDHLHPNMAGYFLMSKSYHQAMIEEGFGPEVITTENSPTLDSLLLLELPFTWYDSIVAQRTIFSLLGNYPFVPLGTPNPYQSELDSDGLKYKINSLEEIDSLRTIIAGEYLMEGDSIAFAKEMKVLMSYFPAKEHHYLKAIQYLGSQRLLDEAFPIIVEQLKKLKESNSKNKMLGLYYMHKKYYGMASAYLEKAARNLPVDTYLYINLGFIHLELEEYAKAVDDFTKVLEEVPDNVEAYHQRGVARFELGDYKGTVQDMDQVIKLSDSPAFLPYLIRGYAKFGLNDRSGACEDWKRAADGGSDEGRAVIGKYCL